MATPRQDKRELTAAQQDRDPEWYLGLDGEILGPMDREELSRRLSRCTEASDPLVWHEGMEEWVEPRALPETAQMMPHETLVLEPEDLADLEDFFEQRSVSSGEASRDPSEPAGLDDLREFFVKASDEDRWSILGGASIVEPPPIPARPPPRPAPPRESTPTPETRPKWPLLVLASILGLSLLAGLVAVLVESESDAPTPERGPVEKGDPLPTPPVLAEEPALEPSAKPATAPPSRPRPTHARPVRPLPPPTTSPSTAPAPGEEPLPATKGAQRKWLTDVQGQLRDLHKRRGALRRLLAAAAEKGEELPPEERTRQRRELRQMRFRIRAAHKLRGRLLEELARDAPPLPGPE